MCIRDRDKEILAGKKDLKVVMEEQTENLEDVVVTGIFTRKKEGFTGSATRVSRDEIKRMTSGNVLKALEMLDPGFRMNASNLAGSNPNAIPDFQMRGQASMGNYQSCLLYTSLGPGREDVRQLCPCGQRVKVPGRTTRCRIPNSRSHVPGTSR